MTERTVGVNGTALYCVEEGTGGPPLLVMHGGLGLDHTYFRPALDPLAKRRRVVFYDHRGNGRSRREPLGEVTHATWVEDAEALRQALGLGRMVLLGHSYGGFLALEYALKHGANLAGLVLSNTAPALDYPAVLQQNLAARASPELLRAAGELAVHPPKSDEDLAARWRTLLPLYFHRPQEALIERLAAGTRYSAEAYVQSMGRCAGTYDVSARLKELRVPTLVVAGADDWITPVEQGGARLARGISGARLAALERSGHFPFLEESAAFLSAVESFLAGLG